MGQGFAVGLKRLERWPLLLSDFLHSRRDCVHAYGANDCLLFPADCINALTGVDFAKKWRGFYANEAQAKEIINKEFGGSIATPFYNFLGEPLTYPKMRRRGDVCVFDYRGRPCGGVIDDTGKNAAFITYDDGMIRVPVDETMLIWGYG